MSVGMKDTHGVEIEIGDLVAFNRSGFVMKGVVEKFGRGWKMGWDPYAQGAVMCGSGSLTRRVFTKTYIRCSKDKKVSIVNRPTSILVIAKQVTTNQIGCPIWSNV